MGKKRSFKYNVLKTWSFSYLVVFVIPIFLFLVFLSLSISLLDREVGYYNSLAIEHVGSQFDKVFQQINQAAEEFLLDDSISSFTLYDDVSDIPSFYLYQEVASISRIVNSQSVVEGLILFSPDLDLYLSGEHYGRISFLPDMKEYSMEMTSGEVEEIFRQHMNFMQIFDASFSLPSGNLVRQMLVVRPLNFAEIGKRNRFYIAAVVSISDILGSSTNYDAYHDLMIFSRLSGEMVYDISDSGDIDNVKLDEIVGSRGESRDSMTAVQESKDSNFVYVVRIDKAEYFRMIYLLLVLALAYVAFTIVFGFIFCLRNIRKNWKELSFAIEKTGADTEQAENIYSPFVSSVSRLEEEKAGLSMLVASQTDSLKTSMIEKLVLAQDDAEFISKRALLECGIEFVSDVFLIYLVCGKEGFDVEKLVIDTFASPSVLVYPFSSAHGSAFLFNFQVSPGFDESKTYHDIAIQSKGMMAAHPEITDAAASDLAKGLAGIGTAYLDTINTLEYKKNNMLREFVFYRDIVEMSKHARFSYPSEVQYTIAKAVEDAKGDEAVDAIRRIVDENRANGVSPRHMRYLLFSIANTVLRISQKLEDRYPGLKALQIPPIMQTRNFEASQLRLEENVKSLCESVIEMKNTVGDITKENYSVYSNALALISSRYSDAQLNVSEIADHLGVSIAFLSKVFKKYHNMNISDYISRYRVQESKKMLLEKVSINEIVDLCGFGSLRTYMRVFKKFEGVTPGKYRVLNSEEL